MLRNILSFFNFNFNTVFYFVWDLRICMAKDEESIFMNEWLILLKSFNYPSTVDVDFNYKLICIKPSSIFYRKYIQ